MKTFSQSDLYSPSLSPSHTSNLHIPTHDVTPNIHSSDNDVTTTTSHRRIFAFSNRRRRISDISDDNTHVAENRLILKSLNKLLHLKKKRKRKRKSKNEEEGDELEGLGVMDVNGEMIDLKLLATTGDAVFESALNRMTEGMENEEQFLGFLNGLEGRWGSTRKRRKYVDAVVLVKALPVDWKVLLSLRPRVRHPSLYCRRFVSPSEIHFNSCKDVAFYLKSQIVKTNASPREREAMLYTDTDCQMDIESGARIPTSASEVGFLGTNNLHKIEGNDICKDSCTPIVGLQFHLQRCEGNKRLDIDALTRNCSIPPDLLPVQESNYPPPIIQSKQTAVAANKDTAMNLDELKNIVLNGEVSANETKHHSEGNRNFKTRCIWCLVEFFREPVDEETLASSCGFICPKCKQDVSWRFESALSELTQHTDM